MERWEVCGTWVRGWWWGGGASCLGGGAWSRGWVMLGPPHLLTPDPPLSRPSSSRRPSCSWGMGEIGVGWRGGQRGGGAELEESSYNYSRIFMNTRSNINSPHHSSTVKSTICDEVASLYLLIAMRFRSMSMLSCENIAPSRGAGDERAKRKRTHQIPQLFLRWQ